MAKQYGNSGRGTDVPAPSTNDDRDRAKTPGSNPEDAGSPDRSNAAPRGGGDARQDDRRPQPGGAKHSESERPSSPDSRWGGGHGPG